MREANIACIVEGHGEVEAVPILVRRIVQALDSTILLRFPTNPIRIPRDKFVKTGELERAVELAALKNRAPGAILILLDADDDCPKELAPQLLLRARNARSDMPIRVVLAKREFEAWFLAAAESLRGQQGLSSTLEPPPDPEAIQGAKEWLRKHMEANRTYSETVDQPALTRCFDMEAARQAPSFDKLYRDVEWLLQEIGRSDMDA
jgi:hypothetical protein